MSVVTASSNVLDAGSSPAISTLRQVRQYEGLPFFLPIFIPTHTKTYVAGVVYKTHRCIFLPTQARFRCHRVDGWFLILPLSSPHLRKPNPPTVGFFSYLLLTTVGEGEVYEPEAVSHAEPPDFSDQMKRSFCYRQVSRCFGSSRLGGIFARSVMHVARDCSSDA